MDETGGYVKCEKAEQPKNNQNCGDYPKHVFFSLSLSTRTTSVNFFQAFLMLLRMRGDDD
jgi:hypothetical protein